MIAPTRPFIFLAALALAGVEAKSDCWTSVHNETIACFNSAPIAFSFDLDTASDCQSWCGKIPNCEAWIYINQSSQCDLHRTAPVSISDNSGFTFGGCDPVPIIETRPVATPIPSSNVTASSTRAATETSSSVRFGSFNLFPFRVLADNRFL
ncbi:uncharacterized protein CDV56_104746 [Aspergillus thermomutatus]|uniref:Apple domain-containing protein n=1 Tax=Aspergillus thermomutatus TaxID=41047 RepID=A0A397G7V1_ASPTH|nr:uncharacterized protein CDV56_104746 [Aspergillus thermomutatus]RHZ46089.1 hypothetical protein CDV56_104746 [Aspergillus thermomutatus]